MADPTVTKLREIARKRTRYLRDSEKGLLSKTSSLQKRLHAYVINKLLPSLEISNNRIKNTNANLLKINKASKLKKFVREVINQALFSFYEQRFGGITTRSDRYFKPFNPSEATTKNINNRVQTSIDGFVDDLFDNNKVVSDIQAVIRSGITTNQRTSELKDLLTNQIKGREGKLGSLESFHYQNGYNSFQSYARGLDEEFSEALKLNYAIYAGGEIKTTRDFCDERNGNVYNRETILSWQGLEWQGKKENHNILIDLGGYNCRHDLDWISFALAKRINPEIEKSKFDK